MPLSSQRGPTLSTGLLVDTNLDTSSPDTYRPPPAPMPYDVAFGRPHSPPPVQEISVDKNGATAQTTNSDTVQEAGGGNVQDPSVKCEDLKESDCKAQTDVKIGDTKELEVELSKSVQSVVLKTEEEDVCPICLEGKLLNAAAFDFLSMLLIVLVLFPPIILFTFTSVILVRIIDISFSHFLFFRAEYDTENPKLTTKCEHHFHLACILEWMERSEACPVCDQVSLKALSVLDKIIHSL